MSQAKQDAEHPIGRGAKHVVVMVLGDIGRSPRMQYHALSLLEDGHYVTLIGYAGEGLVPPLEMASSTRRPTEDDDDDGESSSSSSRGTSSSKPPPYRGRLHVLRMAPYQLPRTVPLYRLLYYPIRLLSLSCCVICALWIRLGRVPHTRMPADVILVQNPPSAPTLFLACAYRAWRGAWGGGNRPRLVIDWHNLGYTMFDRPDPTSDDARVRSLARAAIRNLAGWHERTMATRADAHLTVTRAMETWLGENFDVHGRHVRVLYDRPPSMFRPTGVEEQHELFGRLKLKCDLLKDTPADDMEREHITGETMFTQSIREGGGNTTHRLRRDRPALLVSSTSWTPDEDFSILLTALRELHKKIETIVEDGTFPKALVIVTGKGPQKAHYLPLIEEFNETHLFVNIQTLWLEADDYPKLVGCATLGISLHTSTSGLDLPMKVLDFFGCEVPVCAIGFDCLGELVQDGVNGNVFANGEELATLLLDLLRYHNDGKLHKLETYRKNIRGMTRWKENWEECARNLIVGESYGNVL
ncbi:hypothetical protein ACHAW5_006198 [Stephanodiscus triporus]|uniref:Chitobiosyldiphosphodolichol beta-mannosyltransferase n=1 Tax=Stephanodiscus triporus TaxID=2934178 RepID=A0ABD3MUC4_9STRA